MIKKQMAISSLKNMRLFDVYTKLQLADEDFEEWIRDMGLLHQSRSCKNCGNPMTKSANPKRWRCYLSKCRTGESGQTRPSISIYNDTFFEKTHLPIKKIFLLSYFWCLKYGTIADQEYEIGISQKSIVQWTQYFRDTCAEFFVRNPNQIGGIGKTVELDETCVSKRKYNRGRLIRPNQWMFGGKEQGSAKSFLVLVDKPDANSLLPIIQQYILPGTTVISDLWRSYGGIENLPEDYNHLTVNHSINFVDPETGAHTQNVKNLWMKFKMKIKKSHGLNTSSNERYNDYLQEFMWRQCFGDRSEVFFNFWSHISDLYQCS